MRKMMEEYGMVIVMAVVILALFLIAKPISNLIRREIYGAHEVANERTANRAKSLVKKNTWCGIEQYRTPEQELGDESGTFIVTVFTESPTDQFEFYVATRPNSAKEYNDAVKIQEVDGPRKGTNDKERLYTVTVDKNIVDIATGYKVKIYARDIGTQTDYESNELTFYGKDF